MASATPVWTQAVSVVAAQVLARGSTVRGTLDLRALFGARIFARIGRGGTTALAGGTSVGVNFMARAINNNDAAGTAHPGSGNARLSSIAAAASTTCATSDSNSGQPALNVASITGFAADDVICIQDADAGVTRLEWHRVSKTATGILTLDRNLQFTHTSAGADTVRSKSDVFDPIWLFGGSLYEVIFDYGDQTAGESVTVIATAQTYDSDLIA
jgi:hypothetical protein